MDGKLIEEIGPNVTLGPFKVGTSSIALRVTDDEGAWNEVNASLEVYGRSRFGRLLEKALSPQALVAGLVLLMVVLGLGTVLARRVRDLPTPVDEVPEQEVGASPLGPADGKEGPVPGEIGKGPEPPAAMAGPSMEGVISSNVPPLEVPPLHSDTFGMDMPPPPETEGLEMPDMSMDAVIPNDIGSKVDT